MRNPSKSLKERIYSFGKSFKKAIVYAPIAAAGIALASYSPVRAQSRITEEVTFDDGTTFDGTTTKSYIAQDPDKWVIRDTTSLQGGAGGVTSGRLEAEDFAGASGYTRFSFNDKLYNIASTNMSLEVTIDKSAWGSGSERSGLMVCGDPTQGDNGTYYQVLANFRPGLPTKIDIVRKSPGLSKTYVSAAINGLTAPIKPAMVYNNGAEYTDARGRVISTGYNFFVSDNTNTIKIPTTEIDPVSGDTINLIGDLPLLEGYVGNMLYDSMGSSDPAFTSTTYFDNFTIEYDAPQGGAIREKRILGRGGEVKVHVPDVFLRGDSNMDGNVGLPDAVFTLKGLFTGDVTPRCFDAADANDDGNVDLGDPIKTLFHTFKGELLPPPNEGVAFGMDLTLDNLPKCEGLPYTPANN